jgi:tether containing UBX domain for GLUT4
MADEQATTAPTPDHPEQPFTIYKAPQSSPQPAPDLPDSFFTPTSSDLKAAQATLSARTQNLVNAPLQVRAAREATAKAKAEKWPNTTIRIRFTDRTQLEKVFPSTDKIRSVYAFVRNLLREDVKPIKFILYQSPPKRDLKVSDPKVRDLTLYELQLAPSSVLLLRFEDDKLNGSNVRAPLVEMALSQAIDLPKPPEIPIESPPAAPSVSKTPFSAGSSSKSGEQKVPKWLKLPGKSTY